MKKISVLMSVYKNDKPEWFQLAIESVINQTYKPDEIVLIQDGEVGEGLSLKIKEMLEKYPLIKFYANEQNIGLGLTLQKGINLCENELIARMDSDDYSHPTRFEEQIKYFEEKNLDLIGCIGNEFIYNLNDVVSIKKVPLSNEEILKFSKLRCPFVHPSVVFKKSKVLEAGNYLDLHYCEDYYLWVRMLQKGAKCENIEKPLLSIRVNADMYARRGGYKYFKAQKKLFKYMRKTKFIGIFSYTKTCFVRFCVQVLMPNKLRQKFYMKHLRGKQI